MRFSLSRCLAPLPHETRVRNLYLRLLGGVYFTAFGSLALQVQGLIGRHGVLPAAPFLASVKERFGTAAYFALPTLCHWGASDGFLSFLCWGGAVLGLALAFGAWPRATLVTLWIFFLSLVNVGDVFLGYQWESLLLEAGFLALLVAPRGYWLRRDSDPPLRLGVFLHRFLVFRLLFSSGCAKLLSQDPTWRDLTALAFHYETQPLPTPLAWAMAQLPLAAQKVSTFLVFVLELVVPWGLLWTGAPRLVRRGVVALEISFQLFILLTGNYAYFNWLTMALCLWALEDSDLRLPSPGGAAPPGSRAMRLGVSAVGGWLLFVGAAELLTLFAPAPGWVRDVASVPLHLRLSATYGLFAVMTTERDELQIEGSRDAKEWKVYPFRWKPGRVTRAPAFVAPYQPRLDWQAWFAALGEYEDQQWLKGLLYRLLQNEPSVLRLLGPNPFPDEPPKYVRVQLYTYQFAPPASGAWWTRRLKGAYSPTISLGSSPVTERPPLPSSRRRP